MSALDFTVRRKHAPAPQHLHQLRISSAPQVEVFEPNKGRQPEARRGRRARLCGRRRSPPGASADADRLHIQSGGCRAGVGQFWHPLEWIQCTRRPGGVRPAGRQQPTRAGGASCGWWAPRWCVCAPVPPPALCSHDAQPAQDAPHTHTHTHAHTHTQHTHNTHTQDLNSGCGGPGCPPEPLVAASFKGLIVDGMGKAAGINLFAKSKSSIKLTASARRAPPARAAPRAGGERTHWPWSGCQLAAVTRPMGPGRANTWP